MAGQPPGPDVIIEGMALRTVKDPDPVLYLMAVAGLPLIPMEYDRSTLENTQTCANGRILAQHTADHTASRYFFLHNRLDSIRELIEWNGATSRVARKTLNILFMHTFRKWRVTHNSEIKTRNTGGKAFFWKSLDLSIVGADHSGART
ncbi:MAG: hypothetical protein ACYS9T_09230 [Planctomycetota bacterium]|jgi:hypothetical protein